MLIISAKKHLNRIKICDKIIKRVEKVNTLLDGNAVRKNRRFLTEGLLHISGLNPLSLRYAQTNACGRSGAQL